MSVLSGFCWSHCAGAVSGGKCVTAPDGNAGSQHDDDTPSKPRNTFWKICNTAVSGGHLFAQPASSSSASKHASSFAKSPNADSFWTNTISLSCFMPSSSASFLAAIRSATVVAWPDLSLRFLGFEKPCSLRAADTYFGGYRASTRRATVRPRSSNEGAAHPSAGDRGWIRRRTLRPGVRRRGWGACRTLGPSRCRGSGRRRWT